MNSFTSHMKTALSIRIAAFKVYTHTVIPQKNRYGFLGIVSVCAVLALAFAPKRAPEGVAVPPKLAEAAPEMDLTRFDMGLQAEFAAMPMRVETIKLKSGDNLGPLLQKSGLSGGEAYRVTQAFATVFKPRNMRVGHEFDLHFVGDKLDHLTFKPNVESTIFVDRSDEDYTARQVGAEFRYETIAIAASVENSLYVDATRLGAPDKVVAQFANIYEYSVDFQRDIQPGDEFEMFFEVARGRNGEIIKAGDLLYTSFSPRKKQSEYWLFEDAKGRENFYDAKGKTAKRKLRATPINGARLSSSYGRRKHPILGYRKLHTGVDFAAPRGTPILAAGSGTVERASRYGGQGRICIMKSIITARKLIRAVCRNYLASLSRNLICRSSRRVAEKLINSAP